MRRTLLALVFSLVLSTIPQLALAATYADAVSGFEIFATPTLGVFTGRAAGSLPGAWTAAVVHTPLSAAPAVITGGSFTLLSGSGADAIAVRGTFSGGSVTQTSGSTGCVNQTYDVVGALSGVGPGGGTGTGTFAATLTHFNIAFFGHCITYRATVNGSVTLSF